VPKIIGVRRNDLSTVPDLEAFFFGTLPYGVSCTRPAILRVLGGRIENRSASLVPSSVAVPKPIEI
jgi:hypothetical protein